MRAFSYSLALFQNLRLAQAIPQVTGSRVALITQVTGIELSLFSPLHRFASLGVTSIPSPTTLDW